MSSRKSVPDAPAKLTDAEDAIICRCEDVWTSDLMAAAAEGFNAPELMKRATRVSMGMCQGRVCRPVYEAYWRARAGAIDTPQFVGTKKDSRASLPVAAELDLPGSRPPVRPLRVSDLADLEMPEEGS